MEELQPSCADLPEAHAVARPRRSAIACEDDMRRDQVSERRRNYWTPLNGEVPVAPTTISLCRVPHDAAMGLLVFGVGLGPTSRNWESRFLAAKLPRNDSDDGGTRARVPAPHIPKFPKFPNSQNPKIPNWDKADVFLWRSVPFAVCRMS